MFSNQIKKRKENTKIMSQANPEPKVEQLLSEKNLAAALGISKQSLGNLRTAGCPYLRLGGRVYFYEPDFMTFVLTSQQRSKDTDNRSISAKNGKKKKGAGQYNERCMNGKAKQSTEKAELYLHGKSVW